MTGLEEISTEGERKLANSAGSLDAAGQNISLESGTKLTLNLSAGA